MRSEISIEPRLPELSDTSSERDVSVLSAVKNSCEVLEMSFELCAVSYSVVVRLELLVLPLMAENIWSMSEEVLEWDEVVAPPLAPSMAGAVL